MESRLITWNDFEAIRLYSGTIVSARLFEKARKPAYIIEVDFGDEIGVKKTSAQVTELYKPDDLIGLQVLGVLGFPPKQIGSIMSEFLLTGCHDEAGRVVLATFDHPLPLGSPLK